MRKVMGRRCAGDEQEGGLLTQLVRAMWTLRRQTRGARSLQGAREPMGRAADLSPHPNIPPSLVAPHTAGTQELTATGHLGVGQEVLGPGISWGGARSYLWGPS